jgi:hypothetical protein
VIQSVFYCESHNPICQRKKHKCLERHKNITFNTRNFYLRIYDMLLSFFHRFRNEIFLPFFMHIPNIFLSDYDKTPKEKEENYFYTSEGNSFKFMNSKGERSLCFSLLSPFACLKFLCYERVAIVGMLLGVILRRCREVGEVKAKNLLLKRKKICKRLSLILQ